MKIFVCGSREWKNWNAIYVALKDFKPENTTVIHRGQRGADKMVDFLARKLGFDVKEYVADWKRFGNDADSIRNQQIFNENQDINLVLAFPLITSKSTWDMIKKTKAANIKVKIIEPS